MVVGVCILWLGLSWVCFGVWYSIASDFSDQVVAGTYNLAQNGETSTLVLRADHSFQQDLLHSGTVSHSQGTWRHVGGYGGIAFSKEFLVLSGQELGADGTPYGDIHKQFGFLVSLSLSTYDVEWYGRADSAPSSPIAGPHRIDGTYRGDEDGVPATLIVNSDHTFEQTVSHGSTAKNAQGTWSTNQKGDIVFSNAFIKTTGDSLGEDETASAWDPNGGPLQIEVDRISRSGAPTFQKKQFPW